MGKRKEVTQEEVVLQHLVKNGTITSLEAINEYGITRISARIFNLRKRGYPIVTEDRKVRTRYGNTVVGVYRLEKEKDL